MTKAVEIAIAGGGPSGAAAAILLARAGASVSLIASAPRVQWIEGAAVRLVAALRAQGLAIEGLGPCVTRSVQWGELTGSANREHILSRPTFDEGLCQQAADAGVRVIRGTIRRVRAGLVELADGSSIRAGLVFEARGRRAPVAKGRLRGIQSVSIAAFNRDSGFGSDAEIRALDDGWLWHIDGLGRRWTQITVDAAVARDPDAVWRGITGTAPNGPLKVRAAELRLAAPELDLGMPRLGDAAVAMDPLSGHGLFWALGSALMAVPLAEALLRGDAALATRFYRDRVAGTFYRQARIGRDFYRAAGRDDAFWARRSVWPDDSPAEAQPPASPYLDRRVVVRNGRLAETEVLVTPQEPEGAAFVDGIEIAPILAQLSRTPVPDSASFATRILPNASPQTAARVFAWLAERGVTTASTLHRKELHL